MQAQSASQWTSLAITVAIVGLVMLFRLRNMRKTRRLRLETLWIVPAVLTVIIGLFFAVQPPHGLVWLYCGLALLFGAALGWQRGRLMTINVDPETHELNQAMSPAAMIFLVVIIALRAVSRAAAVEIGAGPAGVAIATDILLAFALGLLATQRIEMFLRAQRLLAEAQAQSPRS